MQTFPPEIRFPGPPFRLRFAARTFAGSPLSAPASRGLTLRC